MSPRLPRIVADAFIILQHMTRSAVESLLVPIFARKSSLISGRNPSGDEEFTTGLEWFSKRLDSEFPKFRRQSLC